MTDTFLERKNTTQAIPCVMASWKNTILIVITETPMNMYITPGRGCCGQQMNIGSGHDVLHMWNSLLLYRDTRTTAWDFVSKNNSARAHGSAKTVLNTAMWLIHFWRWNDTLPSHFIHNGVLNEHERGHFTTLIAITQIFMSMDITPRRVLAYCITC